MKSWCAGILGAVALWVAMGCAVPARAAGTLVIDMDMDDDLVSLAHAIDGFLFAPTMNFSPDLAGNLVRRFDAAALQNHLSATALVRIDGQVAGFATEQEHVMTDPANGSPVAESSWLITLTLPGRSGVIAVAQRENASGVFGLVQQVAKNPAGPWEDRFQSFLSTSGNYRVALATQDLAPYLGGRFEEYNLVNPADLVHYKRFRGRIQFLIRPKE